jgi:hypothetical protein
VLAAIRTASGIFARWDDMTKRERCLSRNRRLELDPNGWKPDAVSERLS